MRVAFRHDSNVVENLDIFFGGVGPTLVKARHTCKELLGRYSHLKVYINQIQKSCMWENKLYTVLLKVTHTLLRKKRQQLAIKWRLTNSGALFCVANIPVSEHWFLLGRKWDEKLLVEGTQHLEEEISVPSSAPGGREEYRKALVLSFFFKFYMQVLLELQQKVWLWQLLV